MPLSILHALSSSILIFINPSIFLLAESIILLLNSCIKLTLIKIVGKIYQNSWREKVFNNLIISMSIYDGVIFSISLLVFLILTINELYF